MGNYISAKLNETGKIRGTVGGKIKFVVVSNLKEN